jgi:hypothetical protein
MLPTCGAPCAEGRANLDIPFEDLEMDQQIGGGTYRTLPTSLLASGWPMMSVLPG